MRPIPYNTVLLVSRVDPRDATTLHACSLTHSSWSLDAQRRFHKVEIRNWEDAHRWDKFDERDRFMPHVRHLIYSGDQRPHDFLEAY